MRGAAVPLGLGHLQGDPGFGRFATAQFLAQALAQDVGDFDRAPAPYRDAPARASDAYRQSGAEPPVHGGRSAILHITA